MVTALLSDLFTIINELFRWFSRTRRLFFLPRLTSCYRSVRFFLLYAPILSSPFVLLCRRAPSLPPIASAPVISSFPLLLFFWFLSFYRRTRARMALSLRVPPSRFAPTSVVPRRSLKKRINVSDYDSARFPNAVTFNLRIDISNVSITTHPAYPLLRDWRSWLVCNFIREDTVQLAPHRSGERLKGDLRWWPIDTTKVAWKTSRLGVTFSHFDAR